MSTASGIPRNAVRDAANARTTWAALKQLMTCAIGSGSSVESMQAGVVRAKYRRKIEFAIKQAKALRRDEWPCQACRTQNEGEAREDHGQPQGVVLVALREWFEKRGLSGSPVEIAQLIVDACPVRAMEEPISTERHDQAGIPRRARHDT